MLIDWFTVGAQALNFLVLVWLLRRYLYKPVLAAIDARERKVAATIGDAATQVTTAQAASAALRKRSEEFDRERDALMRKAVEEGGAERQRLLEAAREDSQRLRVTVTQALDAERAELERQLSVRMQAEVFALTRKALSDLAGAGLEERVIEVFIDQLRELPQQQKLELAGAQAVLVRGAYDASAIGRAKLEAAIHEQFNAHIVVRFQTAPELVCGLELAVNGVKLAWSVADYLSTLAQDAAALAAPELAAPEAPAHVH
ncbi:MAG TPA: hypothetical protein VK700_11910 [Steroidobacteraceae bacterium]|jgi:F-type H+-transporting ATPase subunit b|nr:hypothetical protein [Steroidobacteraceae bacterium]